MVLAGTVGEEVEEVEGEDEDEDGDEKEGQKVEGVALAILTVVKPVLKRVGKGAGLRSRSVEGQSGPTSTDRTERTTSRESNALQLQVSIPTFHQS